MSESLRLTHWLARVRATWAVHLQGSNLSVLIESGTFEVFGFASCEVFQLHWNEVFLSNLSRSVELAMSENGDHGIVGLVVSRARFDPVDVAAHGQARPSQAVLPAWIDADQRIAIPASQVTVTPLEMRRFEKPPCRT